MRHSDIPSPLQQQKLPSYRLRYAVIVSVLALLFVVVAVVTYRYIADVSTRNLRAATQREQSLVYLNDGYAQLHRVQLLLHGYLMNPTSETQQRLQTSSRQVRNAFNRLADDGESSHDLDAALITRSLYDSATELGRRVDELIEIRSDPARWFPASQIIENELQPNNSLFVAHLDALIDSTASNAETDAIESLERLYGLRKAWLRMTDELRLIIANRFGAHAIDPRTGMRVRAQNVTLYAGQVDEMLVSLAKISAPDSDKVVATQIESLSAYAEGWRDAYQRLATLLDSAAWRTDTTYMSEQIEPLLGRMAQRLDILRVELQSQSRKQVDTLAKVSLGLGIVLVAALAILLLFGIIGYFSVDRLILRPIRLLAENLKAHARNAQTVQPMPPAVSETRDLLNAFAEMQAQVRSRERQLDHLAHHDPLSGLPNRTLFRRKLAMAVDKAVRHEALLGLLFIDLDRFKQINDSYGHAAGDQMLIEIARRLSKVFRQGDIVARLGGDEFAVLLENLNVRDEMSLLAAKALSAIKQPFEFEGHVFYSGASIGIAVAPTDGTDPDHLIQQADAAMYAAKRDDGSSYRYVSEELTAAAVAQHTLENELRDAVKAHELQLHFQPVIAMGDGHLHCYESLLRWPHSQQGMLRPASFMDALADAGLCSAISDWALDQIPDKSPDTNTPLSINLSARLLHDDAFAQRLFDRLDTGRLAPSRLILEITEDTLESDLRAASRVLHELKRRGVRIALDDFGTGHASLGHLRRFPFDYVKIDQSFIAGIGKVHNDEKLIQAIIRLAHALGMKVVAEGVETDDQRTFLAAEQCDYLQGYLVGRPAASSV